MTGPGTIVAADAQLFTETGECPGGVLVLAQGGYPSWLEVCASNDEIEVNLAAARRWLSHPHDHGTSASSSLESGPHHDSTDITSSSSVAAEILRAGLHHSWDMECKPGVALDPARQEQWPSCDQVAPVLFVVAPAYIVNGRSYCLQYVYTSL